MKAFYSIILSIFFISLNASEKTSPSIYDQMFKLNKYWAVFQPDDCLNYQFKKLNEKELIQNHLLTVESYLRNHTPSNLSLSQEMNRQFLLNELKKYAHEGVFPINSYHSERTPYFIDKYGTACAVGQLIIKSGNRDLALKISDENNYDYIEDMDFPELQDWAKKYGFNELELKWIQPSYGPYCPKGSVIDPYCEGQTGCINLDYEADSLIPPFTELFEYNNGNGWEVDSNGGYMHFVGARIGDHRITVTDSMNTKKVYEVTINDAPETVVDSTVTPSSYQLCDGKARLVISNRKVVFSTYLYSQELNYSKFSNDSYFDSLCSGVYTAVLTDQHNCQYSRRVTINESTSLYEIKIDRQAEVFPNPFSDELLIRSDGLRQYDYKLYTLTGKLIKEGDLRSLKINTESLQEGVFFIELSNGINRFSQKIIKSDY